MVRFPLSAGMGFLQNPIKVVREEQPFFVANIAVAGTDIIDSILSILSRILAI